MGFFDRLRGRYRADRTRPDAAAEAATSSTHAVDLAALAGGADRIAVVDCETTGVYASDRIVEIAIVTMDLNGQVAESWDTLVQPQRDVSASHIHGLTAATLIDAPTFDDVAGDIAVRVHGACIAAHNLPFDARMLTNEFDRLGTPLSIENGIDTLAATRSRLGVACEQYDIPLDNAHCALADARATAQLLLSVRSQCATGGAAAAPLTLMRSGKVLRRSDAAPVALPDPPFLAAMLAALDLVGLEARVLSYLELVQRALADLHLDATERLELATLAGELGLDDAQRAQAHRRFLDDLTDAALADHVVTSDELDTLLRIAAALELDAKVVTNRTAIATDALVTLELRAGLTVVFTGDDPDHPREELVEHARALGLTIGGNVTKTTSFLVAYDPTSRSGKATKARSYGRPIVGTDQFAHAHVGSLLEAHGSTVGALKVVTCPECFTMRSTMDSHTGSGPQAAALS
jgi:DNA polymerase-3 subunit epsilon